MKKTARPSALVWFAKYAKKRAEIKAVIGNINASVEDRWNARWQKWPPKVAGAMPARSVSEPLPYHWPPARCLSKFGPEPYQVA